jgi:hypothetical protein
MMNSKSGLVVVLSAAMVLAAAGTAAAQSSDTARVRTTRSGTFLVHGAPGLPGFDSPGADGVLWTYDDATAIPQSLSLSGGESLAWVGQTLNSERLQVFRLPGDGQPFNEWPAGADSPALVSAANDIDRAVFVDKNAGPFSLHARTSGQDADLWSVEFDAKFNGFGGAKISRDGSTAAALLVDGNAGQSTLYVYNAATGDSIQRVEFTGYGGWVELTADGSLAFVTLGQDGIVIDVATGEEKFHTSANGAGGRFNISANGDVLVLGSFDLRVFVRDGETWTSAFTYNAPTSWFGWGSAVSADGSTVGVISHDYGANYLKTTTRTFDVASHALLGQYDTSGSGQFQDAASGGAMSDDGSRLAVSSWGTENNAHPEVMVFDRQCNLVDSIDTAGSVFSLDVTGSGHYVMSGNKAVHANTFGNGGTVTLLDLGGNACYADLNGDTVLDLFDFLEFTNLFNAGDDLANCDGQGGLDLFDFLCYTNAFNAGC